MSSYCQLYIADYPVFSSNSYAYAPIMTLFRERDKRVFERRVSSRNPLEWSHIESSRDELEIAVEYRALLRHVIQRLDILGFTLPVVQREFQEIKTDEVEKLKEWAEDDSGYWQEEIKILESSTFDDYVQAFRSILSSKVHTVHYLKEFPDASPLIKYILKDHDDFYWGFPCADIRAFIRTALEAAPNDADVIQDLTEVVQAGYYDADDTVSDMAYHELVGDYPIHSKIVVLTEGTTDTEILKPSFELLYPHLYDYYSFMDFGMRPPGGVGSLVNAVKSFAGAGIQNRTIALFDNDTAAFSAVETLKGIDIPPNIAIRHYPDMSLALTYPTIGPGGLQHQDINGLACSIELYFGKDVLEVDGNLTPVQWKGYDERLRRYQGEILRKEDLKNRFLAKLTSAKEDYSTISKQDWSGVNEILLQIMGAFNV